MKPVPLKDATQAQLLRYATVHLNLPGVQPNTGEDKLRERIAKATGEDVIYVQSSVKEDEPNAKRSRNPIVQTNARAKQQVIIDPLRFAYRDPRFLINIAAEKGKGGKAHVPVSVNGTCILLPRGQEIEVPARYFLALRHAIATVIEDTVDDDNKFVRTETEVPQFQFSVLRAPSQDELDDWEQFINDHELAEEDKRAKGLRKRRGQQLDAAA